MRNPFTNILAHACMSSPINRPALNHPTRSSAFRLYAANELEQKNVFMPYWSILDRSSVRDGWIIERSQMLGKGGGVRMRNLATKGRANPFLFQKSRDERRHCHFIQRKRIL